ncbi:hypothetical protein Ancab_026556 [Ancistrocladus abbreviatus]
MDGPFHRSNWVRRIMQETGKPVINMDSFYGPLDGATPDLVCGPAYRELEKAGELVSKTSNQNTRQESGGPMNLEGCRILKTRPKAACLLSHSSGQFAQRFVGLSISSGSSVIRRTDYGNESKVRRSHSKVKFKQKGCILPTVKLGMGARQMSSGGLKRRKKTKSTNTSNNKAISPVGSGLRKRVGNGGNTRFWLDAWLDESQTLLCGKFPGYFSCLPTKWPILGT